MRAKPPSAPPLTLKALDAKITALGATVAAQGDAHGAYVRAVAERRREAEQAIAAYDLRYPRTLLGRLRWLLTGR